MIKFENTEVTGWKAAIRGMRNPMNSWEKGDSQYCRGASAVCDTCYKRPEDEYSPCYCGTSSIGKTYVIGPNDHKLMMSLAKGGPVHAKYRRMITVYVDITAPIYWWTEFDTYKVGTVANSTSTMHKIHAKEFTLDDFSCEHLIDNVHGEYRPLGTDRYSIYDAYPLNCLESTINTLNKCRQKYLETKDKKYWWQMIQLLPNSYHYRRTVMLNYEVLAGIYPMRKNHKLDEWHVFCHWIKNLPYSEIITGKNN